MSLSGVGGFWVWLVAVARAITALAALLVRRASTGLAASAVAAVWKVSVGTLTPVAVISGIRSRGLVKAWAEFADGMLMVGRGVCLGGECGQSRFGSS